MGSNKKRKRHSAEFKARIALEKIVGQLNTQQIASKFSVHRNLIAEWRKHVLERLPSLFENPDKCSREPECIRLVSELREKVARLETERMWLEEKIGLVPLKVRREYIDKKDRRISVRGQCRLLGLNRSTIYYRNKEES